MYLCSTGEIEVGWLYGKNCACQSRREYCVSSAHIMFEPNRYTGRGSLEAVMVRRFRFKKKKLKETVTYRNL